MNTPSTPIRHTDQEAVMPITHAPNCTHSCDYNDNPSGLHDPACIHSCDGDRSSENDHAFLPVVGHQDDDECTHREDGTDATYCGRSAAEHEQDASMSESKAHADLSDALLDMIGTLRRWQAEQVAHALIRRGYGVLPKEVTTGAALIAAERQRQIDVEGYSHEHDHGHGSYSLWRAARCYEVPQHLSGPPSLAEQQAGPPGLWAPWDPEAWKPRDIVSNLIRAGALYQAALDVAGTLGQDVWAARAGLERCRKALDEILAYRPENNRD